MSTRPRVLGGLVAVASLALGGCSPANVEVPLDAAGGVDSSDDTSPVVDAGVDADFTKPCQDYAYAYCGQLFTCSSVALQERYGTKAVCESIQQDACRYDAQARGTGQTPATIEACTAAIPSWDCTDFIYTQNRPPACQEQMTGSLSNGAACAVRPQCLSGYCGVVSGQACGTCAAPPVTGSSCAETPCPAGLSCIMGTCVAYAQQGGACSTAQPCNEGLSCAPGSTPGSTVCESGVTTMGASCAFTGAGCDFFGGLACNAQSGTCATLQFAQPGQACGIVAYQNTACSAGACSHGQCVGYIPPGGACNPYGGGTCMNPLRCVATTDGGTDGTCQYGGTETCP